MITPLTITSLSQGVLRDAPKSDSDYWDRPADQPQAEDLPFWHALKLEWPRWSLRRRADHL